MEADSGVTSEERKEEGEEAGDVVDGGSPDVRDAAMAPPPDAPTPDTDDAASPTNDAVVDQPQADDDQKAEEQQPEVAEAKGGEVTPPEMEPEAEAEAQEQEATPGVQEEEAEAGAAGETTGAEGETPQQDNAAGEATARAESATGEGEATDAGETTAEEQEVSQTPLVVRVDRRRLTTTPAEAGHAQAPPPSIPGPRLPALRGHAHGQGQGHIKQLPSPPEADVRGRKGNEHLPTRPRLPPKLVRLATVTVSPSSSRPKMAPRGPSLYYEAPSKPSKVITWDAAMAARPPLPVDLEGPTPWTYSPRNKPLYETNAPAFSFGRRCQPEKGGGARTAWSKTWFQTPHVWLNKTDFVSDDSWPSPAHYRKRGLLGPRQRTVHEAPAFTIGQRKMISLTKKGAEKEPAPSDYDRQTADAAIFRRGASFSHQFRRQGTVLWGSMESTPGPAAYTPLTKWRRAAPSGFTIQGTRRQKSSVLGPFATL